MFEGHLYNQGPGSHQGDCKREDKFFVSKIRFCLIKVAVLRTEKGEKVNGNWRQ